MRKFYEVGPDLSAIVSHDGRFLYLNPSWEKVLGHSLEYLINKNFMDFVHPEDRDMSRSEQQRIDRQNITQTFINRYITHSGATIWLEWRSKIDTETLHYYCIVRDITKEKKREQLEKELEKQKQESALLTTIKSSTQLFQTKLNEKIFNLSALCEKFSEEIESSKFQTHLKMNILEGRRELQRFNQSFRNFSHMISAPLQADKEMVSLKQLITDLTFLFKDSLARHGVELETQSIKSLQDPFNVSFNRLDLWHIFTQLIYFIQENCDKNSPRGQKVYFASEKNTSHRLLEIIITAVEQQNEEHSRERDQKQQQLLLSRLSPFLKHNNAKLDISLQTNSKHFTVRFDRI